MSSRIGLDQWTRSRAILTGFAVLLAIIPAPSPTSARPTLTSTEAADEQAARQRAVEGYGRLPMAFEPNLGQADEQVRYVARGRGYSVFVTDEEVVLSLAGVAGAPSESPGLEAEEDAGETGAALRMQLAGAGEPRVAAERELAGKSNYLIGSDESRWLRDVPTFEAVRWEGAYEGVDAVFYGTQQQLEYDFVVRPGADASRIRVRFEGQESAEITEEGELVLRMRAGGEIRQSPPVVFEQDGEEKRRVAARYVQSGDGEVRFDVGEYDRRLPLVIDPVLVYSAFLGGGGGPESCEAVAVDASGNAYVAGSTASPGFPRVGGIGGSHGGSSDVFVTKLNAAGTALVYSTYFGGTGADSPSGIAIDASGAAYVTGRANSANFPTTAGAFDTTLAGSNDVFVAKLSSAGNTLVYSTLLGGVGIEGPGAIAVDAAGAAYVSGSANSADFPTTAGAFDTTFNGNEAFVTKLSSTGASLVYSTFIGGTDSDAANAIAIDASGAAFVTGLTASTNFPTTAGAFDTTDNPSLDAFVTKVAANGASLVYSTYLGGGGSDAGNAVAVDASGNVYVAGETTSTNFPTTAGAFDSNFSSNSASDDDGFVTKLNASGTALVFSTYVGGNNIDEPRGIAVDASGAVYVAGYTTSTNHPTVPGSFDTTVNFNGDAFVTKVAANGASLVYSSFLGSNSIDAANAIAVDASGAAYVVGETQSASFPTTAGAYDTTFNGAAGSNEDGFVTKVAANGGSLVYSTFLGGTADDDGNAIAVDASGAAYVTGRTESRTFPRVNAPTENEHDGGNDVYVTKLDASGTAIVYSLFLGGSGSDVAEGIAVDATGAAYVTGRTTSTGFGTTAGAFDRSHNGGNDAFVVKVSPAGNALAYSTFLGGEDEDESYAITVDASGAAYVTGETESASFPTTAGSFDPSLNGGYDVFVTKLAPAGNALAYSTFLGGSASESGSGIAVDASGAAYVVGFIMSTDFPTTGGAFDTTYNGEAFDAFVTKLAPAGNALTYSTFLGGNGLDFAAGVAVDASGAAYVTGRSESTNFPTTPGAFDTSPDFSGDAFVTKLAASGASLVYSTCLGGNSLDGAIGIAIDATGAAYVTGQTLSPGFPTSVGAVDTTFSGFSDAFVSKLSPTGTSILYSTYLGGGADDFGTGIAVDASGAAYVVGGSRSTNFPTSGFGFNDARNAFVAKLTTVDGSVGGTDTAGIYVASTGAWFLRNSNTAGNADLTFFFGPGGASLVAITGDWDGDGDDTPGLYDPATGAFFLKNASAGGAADLTFFFGAGGAGIMPLSGDWNGDGADTIGLYSTTNGAFFLKNTNAGGAADLTFFFGAGGAGILPLRGDWDGDGADTIGIYNSANGSWFLRNANAGGAADLTFFFGAGGAGILPLRGDWDGDGDDTVGIYNSANGSWFLRNANSGGNADLTFFYGPAGAAPLSGDWDGL